MRLAWAIVAGLAGAVALTWWLARDAPDDAAPAAGAIPPPAGKAAAGDRPAGPTLYRWRDAAGIVQITDVPPRDREYTVVDVAVLERRNLIDPDPASDAAP